MRFFDYGLVLAVSLSIVHGFVLHKYYVRNFSRQLNKRHTSLLNSENDDGIIEVDKFRFKFREPDTKEKLLSDDESYTVGYDFAHAALEETETINNMNSHHASLESAQQWYITNEFPSVEDDNIRLEQYVETILSRGYFQEVHPDIGESWKTIKRRYAPMKFLQWLIKDVE